MNVELETVLGTAERAIDMARARRLRFPSSVVFANGAFEHLGRYASAISARGPILVVGGRYAADPDLRARIEDQFCGHEVPSFHYIRVQGEPTCEWINRAAALARRLRPQLVLGIGGGSAIDSAKALAALLTNDGPVEDYLDGVGRHHKLECLPAQTVAVPTTAGTGAEMTRNAVIGCPDRRSKRSLRDDRLVPALALVDPDLTVTLGPAATISGGLDALVQLIECCVSARAKAETTALAMLCLPFVRRALTRCVADPDDIAARSAMSMTASISGICLANSGLGMAHGIAAALGMVVGLPHGLACGLLLPHVLRFNRPAAAVPMGRALSAFLGERTVRADSIDRGLKALEELYCELGVPSDLRHLNLSDEQIEHIAAASLGRSMEGNPVPVTAPTVARFLRGLAGRRERPPRRASAGRPSRQRGGASAAR